MNLLDLVSLVLSIVASIAAIVAAIKAGAARKEIISLKQAFGIERNEFRGPTFIGNTATGNGRDGFNVSGQPRK